MFSKAKRFDAPGFATGTVTTTNKPNGSKKQDTGRLIKPVIKIPPVLSKPKIQSTVTSAITNDTHSQCSSTPSIKSFTPNVSKTTTATKSINSTKKSFFKNRNPNKNEPNLSEDLIKAQEVEIRNKDFTISEYNKQIDDLKNEIAKLKEQTCVNNEFNINCLGKKITKITINDEIVPSKIKQKDQIDTCSVSHNSLEAMEVKILQLEQLCENLEQELSNKQVELTSLEEIITIRDSLCQDLQQKLTKMEICLEETQQRLEMVKGHHDLALQANESIRREYKVEIETLKTKLEEEKQNIVCKSKVEQENMKSQYTSLIECIKNEIKNEKDEVIKALQQQLASKESEMKAKLEQINEATQEKLRLCEIQFEERTRSIQDHFSNDHEKVQCLAKEIEELKCHLSVAEEQNIILQKEISDLQNENESLKQAKLELIRDIEEVKKEQKENLINFENEKSKITIELDKTIKEKKKFEMSLSVTRDIVQVLTMRLRESDNELEHLENKVQTLSNSKEVLEEELATYKNTLNSSLLECNEYKEALVNILKSKAALAKEHTRIMEHNVSLIESLQNVEKEAYRELGSIKHELIEDVELLKKESNCQIKMLRDEVEKKRLLCELANEHADQTAAAAEQSRILLSQAATEITRLEDENKRLQQQIQDQQSLVVELSLLRQENEELSITVATQSSVIEKMKKDIEQIQSKPKSPLAVKKTHKIGKENMQTVVSPLRERN